MLNTCGHLKMPQFGAILQNWRWPQQICSQFYKLFVLWDYINKKITWLSQMIRCFKTPKKRKVTFKNISQYIKLFKIVQNLSFQALSADWKKVKIKGSLRKLCLNFLSVYQIFHPWTNTCTPNSILRRNPALSNTNVRKML